MGKRLIIKGADFSENGIYEPIVEWYNDGSLYYTESLFSSVTINGGGVGLKTTSFAMNKPINSIRLYLHNDVEVGDTADVVIGKVGESIANATFLRSFTVTASNKANGYVDIGLANSIEISNENVSIMVTNPSNPAGIVAYYYHNESNPAPADKIPYMRTVSGSLNIVENETVFVCMQYGYSI